MNKTYKVLLTATALYVATPTYATIITDDMKDKILLRTIMVNKGVLNISEGARNRIDVLRIMPLTELTTVQADILQRVDHKLTDAQINDIELLNKIKAPDFKIKKLRDGEKRRINELTMKDKATELDSVQQNILMLLKKDIVTNHSLDEKILLNKLLQAEKINEKPKLNDVEKRYLRILAYKFSGLTPLQEQISEHIPLKYFKDIKTGAKW